MFGYLFQFEKHKKNQIVIEVYGWGAWGAAVLRPYMIAVDGALVLRRKGGRAEARPYKGKPKG